MKVNDLKFLTVRTSRLFIIIFTLFLLGACASSQIRMRENLRQVEYEFAGIEFGNQAEELTLHLSFNLKNPLDESMILDSVISNVHFNGQIVAELYHLSHVKIPAGQSRQVTLDLKSKLGMMDWMQILSTSSDKLSLVLKGKAWSHIEYLWWDSLKENEFLFKKELDVKAIQKKIQEQIQETIKRSFGIPGDIIDPQIKPNIQ